MRMSWTEPGSGATALERHTSRSYERRKKRHHYTQGLSSGRGASKRNHLQLLTLPPAQMARSHMREAHETAAASHSFNNLKVAKRPTHTRVVKVF
jgi:hypothetical protein